MQQTKKLTLLTFVISLLTLASHAVRAESSETFGPYTIHFNAIQTDILDPSIAKNYDIKRSSKRGLLNIAVRKDQSPTAIGTPVDATISANWNNLNAQMSTIAMREIREKHAIYYIGEFAIRNEEVLTFTVNVAPEGKKPGKTITFRKKFIVD